MHLAYRAINYVILALCFEVKVLLLEDVEWSLVADWNGYWSFLSYDQLRYFSQADPFLLLGEAFLDQAFARGDRCYAYVKDGTLGAYTWYSTVPTPLRDGLVATFHPDYIYMYKAFTAPAFRGQRLYGIGVTCAFQALMEEKKYRGLVSYVEVHNQPSLKALRRIGFKTVGMAIVIGLRHPLFSYISARCKGIFHAKVTPTPS
ncbi:GNAT family N-acetyltransferase [Microvirga zambiensis]|uniref:GNAT family N-acetyltransferase n=1 Tax=Microvirga zambiensis TaxID=1402137 RepID=UPI00191E5DC8|nr:GNAT family N-acetyltransferase [Microvirga zambiensis]